MIKHIFLDLDDTLLDFHKAEYIAIRSTFDEMGIPSDDGTIARYSEINRRAWERLECGEWTRGEVLVGRFRLLFEELLLDANPERTQAIYEDKLCIGHYFMDGAKELLDELHGKYRLYITSNGTARVQDSRIASANIADYFDGIFISQKIGYDKPRVEFFDRVFEKIEGFSRDEAIIVGDSLTSDILGGKNAGIKTCLYNPGGKENKTAVTPDYEIKTLAELPRLLVEL